MDDAVEVRLREIKQNLDRGISRELTEATVAGVLSLIPGAGSAIQSLLDEKARANLERRWLQLFVDFKTRMDEIHESIPDEDYYGSEKFQTLLALAWQQLATTHDRAKLKLLADALANSGTTDFRNEDTELFLRMIRDLSICDIVALAESRLQSPPALLSEVTYTADEIAQYSRLASMGLLIEQRITRYGIDPPPAGSDRHYHIAQLGKSLLLFIAGRTC